MISAGLVRIVLEPLKRIADAYDANELDDEARKFWGENDEYANTRHPADIELYTGRGGRRLLTLQDCLDARTIIEKEFQWGSPEEQLSFKWPE